jgi:hypothetical protein
MKLVRDEGKSSVMRQRNIATLFCILSEKLNGKKKCIKCSDFRDLMLKMMGIDNLQWDVEDKAAGKKFQEYRRLGDYKANGDAIGGHGLRLETERTAKGRMLLFNDANYKKCKDFLSSDDEVLDLFAELEVPVVDSKEKMRKRGEAKSDEEMLKESPIENLVNWQKSTQLLDCGDRDPKQYIDELYKQGGSEAILKKLNDRHKALFVENRRFNRIKSDLKKIG